MSETNIMRLIVFLSALLFFIFYLKKRKYVLDDKRKIIDLEVARVQQIVFALVICITVFIYLYNPAIDAIYLIVIFALTHIYAYIFATIYYRHKKSSKG